MQEGHFGEKATYRPKEANPKIPTSRSLVLNTNSFVRPPPIDQCSYMFTSFYKSTAATGPFD